MTASLKRVVKIYQYVYLHLRGNLWLPPWRESFEFLTVYICLCKEIFDCLLEESRSNFSLCIFAFARRVVWISHFVYLRLQGNLWLPPCRESFESLTLYIYICKLIDDCLLEESLLYALAGYIGKWIFQWTAIPVPCNGNTETGNCCCPAQRNCMQIWGLTAAGGRMPSASGTEDLIREQLILSILNLFHWLFAISIKLSNELAYAFFSASRCCASDQFSILLRIDGRELVIVCWQRSKPLGPS